MLSLVGAPNTFFLTYRVCTWLGRPDVAKSVPCHRFLTYFYNLPDRMKRGRRTETKTGESPYRSSLECIALATIISSNADGLGEGVRAKGVSCWRHEWHGVSWGGIPCHRAELRRL